ncbi:MAG: S8 family peptidase, partial [Candidatus Methanomethylicaceae archaeon]
ITKDNRTVILSIKPYDPKKLNRGFRIFEDKDGVYVIPSDVNIKKVDLSLFNIKYLIEEKYYNLTTMPLIINVDKEKLIEAQNFIQSIIKEKKAGKIEKHYKIVPSSSIKLLHGKTFYDLLSNEKIKKIWLDHKVKVSLHESVPLIGAPDVWNLGYNGSGIKIAILDTGIDSNHQDFYFMSGASKIIDQIDFTDDYNPYDFNGHGTHVASTAAGTGIASGGFYTGVAPGALLMNVKVLNRYGWGSWSWIISGIEYAAYYGPDKVINSGDEADILSLSLGGGPTDGTDPPSLACDAAVDNGKIVVVAAGNEYDYFWITTPGAARKVITVGASDKYDNIAWFSSRGPTIDFRLKPDLVAPGVAIIAARAGTTNGYISYSGTSMSTPHVSGAAALIKQAMPNLDPTEMKYLLISTSKNIGYDVYTQGGGRLNVIAALKTNLTVAPATVSLGKVLRGIYSFDLAFYNIGNNAIDILLTPKLHRIWYLDEWSSSISLNVTALSIPAGESRGVRVTVNTTNLPTGYYSGILNTNYVVDSSNIHAIFGFSLPPNRLDITFYGLDGNTPIADRLVGVLNNDTREWIYTYTNSEGRATLYVSEGTCYIIGWDWGRNMYTDAYAIRVEQITGDMNITLSLQEAHRISYSPPVSNQIIAWLSNAIHHRFLYLGSSWYYPSTTDIYITSTDLIFSSYYQHYDKQYINVPDPSVLLSPELYSTLFVNKSITGNKIVSFSTSQLAKVEKDYRVALTPLISARIFRDVSCYLPRYWHGWSQGLDWTITSPKKLVEYLGWEIPSNSYLYYWVHYGKIEDQPNIITPYFNFYGLEYGYETSKSYSIASNSHPLVPNIYVDVWSYDSGNIADLYLWTDVFCNLQPNLEEYLYSDYGRFIIKRNGTQIYDSDWFYDIEGIELNIDLPAKIEIELYGDSEMYLSTSALTKLEFEVPINGSKWIYSPISLKIDGLDLNNTHPGGHITGYFFSYYYDIQNPSIEYSLDDGNTWNTAEWSQISPNNVGFVIKNVENSFVSLRVNATINNIKTSYTVIRGFYVGEMITLADFPVPFILPDGALNTMMVVGASDPRGPCDPAHTISVEGGMYIAFALGTKARGDVPEIWLDWQITNYNSTHVIRIFRGGNIITLGGPTVNLISWYYHSLTYRGIQRLAAYMASDAQGMFIYSPTTGNVYRMVNDYGQGLPVTDYAMIVLHYDHIDDRYLLLIAGLSGYSSSEAAKWLSSFPTMSGKAIILRMIDNEGDGIIDTIEIAEIVP